MRNNAVIGESMVNQRQKLKEVKIDVRRFRKYAEMLEREKKVVPTTSAETREERRECTVIYRIINSQRKKVGMYQKKDRNRLTKD